MTTSKKLVLAGSFMLLLSASLTRDLRPSAARGSGGKVSRQYANLPLSFEANAGQTGAPVQFLSRGPGYDGILRIRGHQGLLDYDGSSGFRVGKFD